MSTSSVLDSRIFRAPHLPTCDSFSSDRKPGNSTDRRIGYTLAAQLAAQLAREEADQHAAQHAAELRLDGKKLLSPPRPRSSLHN